MQDCGATLTALSRERCLALMASVPVGRVVFTQNALPAVRVVNFVLDDLGVVFRCAPGGKLAAAVRQSVVAFEADEVDVQTRTGWTVTVIGRACEITDEAELARLRSLPLVSWAPGPMDHLVRIAAELVSGRYLQEVLPPRRPDGRPAPSAAPG